MYFLVRFLSLFLFLSLGSQAVFAQLKANPSPVVSCGQPGQVVSGIPVTITSASGSVTFVVANVASDGGWLTVVPAFETVTPNPDNEIVVGIQGSVIPFPAGTYSGLITLTDLKGARLGTIPVSLQVTAAGCAPGQTGLLAASSGPLLFALSAGVKSGTSLNISNTFPTDLTVVPSTPTKNGQDWLTTIGLNLNVITGLEFPTPLGVGVDTTMLASGQSYTGDVLVRSSNGVSLDIPVTADVEAAGTPQLLATPGRLMLNIPRGTGVANTSIQLTNLGSSAVSAAISANASQSWLSVSPASIEINPGATGSITATIAESGLHLGQNTGSIQIQAGGGSISIPVTAAYGIESSLTANPNPVNITDPGSPVTITVSASAGSVPFSATAFSSYQYPWLTVRSSGGIASPDMSATVTIGVQPGLLPPGPAVGFVTLKTGDGSGALTIPVNVNAGTDSSLTILPPQLSFSFLEGGAPPATQNLTVTGTPGQTYSVQFVPSSGGAWLNLAPTKIPANAGGAATLTAGVIPGNLTPNSYTGQIVLTNDSTGAQRIVPVSLGVNSPVVVAASPQTLAFRAGVGGGATNPKQTVQLTATGGSASFTASTAGVNGAPNFLTVQSSGSTTPATLTVSLDDAVISTLAAGTYYSMVTISSPDIAGGSQSITATLTVSAAVPEVKTIVSSASLTSAAVSPGEVITLFGSNLAGAPVAAMLSGNTLPTMLGDVVVNFDGYAAPLIYVSPDQINALVPYEIAGQTITNVTVTQQGIPSAQIAMRVVDTAPAIFSAGQTGSGQGAILDADSTPNSSKNAAAKGSIVQIFATGEGLYEGAISGAITPLAPPFRVPLAPVSLTVGGFPAQIQFVGEAPCLVSGILQVNAVIPESVPSGAQPILLKIGQNANAGQTITIAVQ